MTQDEIIEMAKQAGLDIGLWEKLYDDDLFGYSVQGIHENLEAFAKLVAAKEREACIELIKSHGPTLANGFMLTEAIRARSISRGEA